ncbi:pentapeptide repeat-containing protein [Sphaerospermopsis aphanizomenoides BCCUSP55]|uniref:pentapeptide repeat-containing protein n=1 Tax=Sphaerospermopsis aphanizomenoides TaxID=459663 RepID=UPI000A8F0BD5|nr:pentapeptide repeat-containing protein [Sphaerospermopsis aphanizomenoides]MBK1987822.1 pentapeptide repeat-containing protein [Sphaerospermopsis aphanizomenoides BCCUSP55]
MKSQIISTAAFLLTLSLPITAQAANDEEIRQLLSTKKCQNCQLANAGLAIADLSGADLRGANLEGANLSRANLTGADLRGANLAGASLFGVNLSRAKLNEANLTGADLRNTYLMNVELTNANLNGTNFQGAVGIPLQIAKPEEFYAWGVAAADKGNLKPAIDYFSQAIALKPDYAGAYLSRGVASYQNLDRKSALEDAQMAAKLFAEQKNAEGIQTAQAFILELKTPYGEKVTSGKPSFMDFVGSLGSVLLQFLPF